MRPKKGSLNAAAPNSAPVRTRCWGGKQLQGSASAPGVPQGSIRPTIRDRSANPATVYRRGPSESRAFPQGHASRTCPREHVSSAPVCTGPFREPGAGSLSASHFGNLGKSFGDARPFGVAIHFAVAGGGGRRFPYSDASSAGRNGAVVPAGELRSSPANWWDHAITQRSVARPRAAARSRACRLPPRFCRAGSL
jgi:hypothetical protein